jgi:hypothetical protein
MKKYGFHYLLAALLIAVLAGACVSPFEGFEPLAEYDAQGRRLVTVTVDLENASRAVNTDVAKAYIDFYEVVFEGPDGASEYYSAVTTTGAGKRLSLRLPMGDYVGYLNAGHLEDDGGAVLLAQATLTSRAVTGSWNFSLTELGLQVNSLTTPAVPGTPGTSNAGDPIYVTFNGTNATIQMTSGGIPYYKPVAGTNYSVVVKVTPGVTNVVKYGSDPLINNVEVKALPRKSDPIPVVVDISSITPSGGFSIGDGSFSFTIAAAPSDNGVANIGFDVAVAAVDYGRRHNGLDPVCWHIRNGINIDAYDNGGINASNSGAGILFAFGADVTPQHEDTYGLSLSLPVIP